MSGTHRAEAPVWEVRLPDRRSSSLSASKPKATLVIWPASDREESLSIPVAPARILSAKRASGEVRPGSRAELLYIVGELCKKCAATRIERLIDRREYSRAEVAKKLRLDGYSQQVVDACVGRACEVGLISDARYADSFIRSKVYAGWGMSRIARELSQRGIDVADVEGWPYEYLDPDDELSRALAVARARGVSGGARAYERLVRRLCSRGFALGVATRAARQVIDEQDDGIFVDF